MNSELKQSPAADFNCDTIEQIGQNTVERKTAQSRPLPRRLVAGAKYKIIRLLGTGGMGEVYLAEHVLLKRLCALKLMRPERAGDASSVARFEREVLTTARLSHRNIIQIFDFGRTEDGDLYYAMEYLRGTTLEEMLQKDGPQPAQRVVHLVRQTCCALQEAHSLGLIHRDIKPANLFAAECGGMHDVLKVLDFGLVKPMADAAGVSLTHDGALSGTPLFMSPEQAIDSDSVDARSDIYSLGAVAYAMLTGHAPFERNNPLAVLYAHAYEPVTPPAQLLPDVPLDLEGIILRCLAKSPADRYQSMIELEQALADCTAADRWMPEYAAGYSEANASGRLDERLEIAA